MVKKHLKTLTVPRSWPVKRKENKFVVRPKPGKSFQTSMPLALVFKNLLKYTKTMKEVKTILQDKEVLVDGIRRKNPKYLVGLMDTISIPVTKEHYRMILNKKNKLQLVEITDSEAAKKIAKITGKTVLDKEQTQLNLYDSRNIIVKKDTYKVGDSIVIDLPQQKISEHLKLEKGSYVYLTSGSHVGVQGKIIKMKEGAKTLLTVKTKDKEFETPKSFVFVIGKDKPILKIE